MLIVNNNTVNNVNKLNYKNNNISDYNKLFNKILEHDLKNYLPNDILVKVDGQLCILVLKQDVLFIEGYL